MNKVILLGVILLTQFAGNLKAQQVQDKDGVITNPTAVPSTYLGETVRLSSLPIDTTLNLPITKHPKLGYHPKNDWYLNPTVNPNALPQNGDPIVQKDYNTTQNRSTQIANWEGIVTNTNPGDPTMDVGPNHVVQMMNGGSGARVQIWDKSGNSLVGPVNFSTLASGGWSGLGDPIVLYDERADRWMLTEFCNGCNDMYIAISTTPDPTGTYYTFSVTASSFPDYPKYSIWDDSYLITANEGTTTSSVYIMDRTAMLAGGAPNAQSFTVPRFGTIGFQATTPVSLMGTTPSGSPAMLMRMRDDAWTGSASDALEIWELDIDWASPGAATLSQTYTLPVSPFESELCGYTSFSCIPQPGGSDLDPLRELLMNRIMYRNFGSYEALVCSHVTDVDGTDHAGIRWYELRNTGSGWSIYQEGTYSPDAENRWMPTIGLSASGNIGLAYNVSSTSTHPEIRYTGRKECDPLGVMTETEIILVDGTANNNSNRWGDYNDMGVDPSDGETFWFTAMYNPATQARTRIGAFKIDPCNPQVQFDNSTYSVNESDASTVSGCLDYYTLNVPISIGIDPSQPADITINVTGGTATQNVDYTISNTSFTLDGATLTGSATILIYNDNNTEGDETITLDYTLNANGGDAVAGTLNQTVTITIIDDDLDPVSMPGVTTTIYSEDFESGWGAVTTNNPSGDTPFQLGNTGTTPNNAYNIPTDNATEFAWIDDDDCNCDQSDVYLYLPTQDLTSYLSATLTFDSYFEDNTYNGVNEDADLVVSTDGGATFTTIAPLVASGIDVSWTSQTFDVSAYTGAGFNDVIFAINYNDGGGWLYGCSVDNFLLTGELPIDIQQAVNTGSGQTANLGPNETVHFYDPTTGDVMMSIVNTSSFDYGCVTVEVDRDGTTPTALEFASAAVADYLHGKTYTVVPTNSNPAGTFDVTLYYKEAEVAAWETITGNSRNDVEVIKVAGNNRIDDVTPANYTSYTIDNIAATLGSFYSDVTFTASFTNGFSGFGAGIYNVPTGVNHTATGTDPLCNGASSGSISFSASGGTAPYEYSVDGGTTWTSSNPVTGLPAGTYSTVARDAGLTQSTPVSVTLTDPAAISMSSTASNPNCSTGFGSITITASGGTGSLQYSIDGGTTFQAGGSFTGLSAGTYNIVVEDVNGCQATGSESILIPTAITMSSSSTDPACSTGTGSITITASGGTGSLQYSIDGGTTFQAGGSFSGLSSGTYNIVVEDANSCQETGTEIITIPSAITVSTASTDATCGNSDGMITITASGGTGSLQYSIDGGTTFQAGGSFTGLAANTYNIVVEDANSCQETTTETVANTSGPTISNVANTDVTCNGGNDGDLTITASGTGSLQYSIDGGTTFQASNTFSGLTANTYTIVVEDGNGCQTTSTGTVSEPAANTFNTSTTAPSCVGASDGAITFSGATGPNPKRYSIDGGANFFNQTNFNGLAAGTYNVAYRDGDGCIVYATVTITDPAAISVSTSSTDANCGANDGTITITASGGTGSLQYSIDGGTTFQASGNFTGLAANTYNIVVEDANSCQETATETINSTTGPSISSVTPSDISCNGANNGSISISATGTATLQYSIDGGTTFQTTSSFTSLSANTYSIVVEDGNGCQSTSSATINEPSAISVSATSTDENCGNTDGTITITASGGTGTLNYSIDGGTTFQTSNSFNGVASGSYSVVVEDANSCQATTTVGVGLNTGPTISSVSDTDPTCFGGNDGSISFTASGIGTLQYSVDNGSTWTTSSTVTGLTSGSYIMYIQDGAGCSLNVGTLTLNDPTQITYTSSSTSASCGNSDGTLTLTGSGGAGSFQYSIDGGTTFQGSGSFNSLSAGSYNVVIEDALGCQTTGVESVSSTSGPSITLTSFSDMSCNNANDGSITVTASGTATLQYSIDGGTTYTTSNNFTGLSAGNYSIAVQDGNGCVTNGTTITINNPTAVSYTASVSDATCAGNDGSITISGTGGSGSLQYSIDGGSTFQASGNFTGLAASTYNIVVEDINNCQSAGTETVGVTAGPSITNESSSDVSCNGGNDGSITITATGTATLQYSIDGGSTFQSSNTFTGLTIGSYDVVVLDGNSCTTAGSTITLTEPFGVGYSSSVVDATCGSNGSITIVGAGGTGSLQYSIDGGVTFQASGSFTGLTGGTYNIVVEDANGCQATGSEIVNTTSGPTISNTSSTDISCNGVSDGSITITATGTATLQYSANGGVSYQTTNTFTGLGVGTYNIMVEDGNGCTTSGPSISITEPNAILFSTSTMDASCGSSNGSITISASGGTGSLQYSIDGGTTFQSSGSFTGLPTGSYNIVVEDANSCQVTGTESIGSTSGPTISNESYTDVTCNGADDASILISATGSGTLNYSIDGGATFTSSGVFTGLSSGSYTIVVRDGNGCITNGSTFNITEPTVITVTTSTVGATCGLSDGSIDISASGGTGAFSYSIDGGSTFQSSGTFTGVGNGTYNIVVEDANGCQETSSASVNSVPGPTILSSAANDISCYGLMDGTVTIVATGASPLSYSIDGGVTFQSSGSFSGLDNGAYVVNIQDVNGCITNTSNLTINEPSAIALSSATTDATCGNSDGSITLSATGGTGTLQYSIDAGTTYQASGSFGSVMAGTYDIVVEDANACQTSSTVTVVNADGPMISNVTTSDETCFGLGDGSVDVIATGTAPIQYSFNGGTYQTSGTTTGVAGTITIDVQDGNGCVMSTSATVSSATQIVLTNSSTDALCGQDNGIATVIATGGTGSYTYLWDDSLAQTNNVATSLSAGVYNVVVTDGNGCEDSTSVTINSGSTMTVNVDVTHESCPDEEDGIIATSVTGGQPPYEYVWSNGETTAIIENLGVGDYTLTVSDDDDCIVTLIIPIENEGGDCIHIPTAISPNADGSNDTWVIGGLEDYPDANVEIYNRWGSLLYSSNDYQNDWDGTFNGENVSAGVYYYVITLNEDVTYTGSITVIR